MSASDPILQLASVTVLVVGDLILDHYIKGTTERTSPEAPVAVVLFREEEMIPGGAANVARNIRAAGANVICVGAVGDDDNGRILLEALRQGGIECGSVVSVLARPTTTKTRIISQSQQMLRLDREEARPIPTADREHIVKSASEWMGKAQAIILSDYAKGVLEPDVIRAITSEASRRGIPLFVDPKGRDYTRYEGAFCLTPNAKEAFEATGMKVNEPEGLSRAAQSVLEMTKARQLVITRGADGVALFRPGEEPVIIPASAREVFDVTGAGDTFIAFLAMATGAGMNPAEAAKVANAAGGVVVGKSGAATVSLSELRNALAPGAVARKLRYPEQLAELGNELRKSKKRIVFTNGCFDFIHVGHVAFFEAARALGEVLVVATNTDEMITRLKGEPRPIIKQVQREKLLAAIEGVDYIVPFPDETPHNLIALLHPDILVKGSNYSEQQVEGHELVKEYGGSIVLLDIVENVSTKDLLARRTKK